MIEVTLHLDPNCPWPVVMKGHEVLNQYTMLPEQTRLATDLDFFAPGEVLKIGKPYFWQRVMQSTFNASRVNKNSYDIDLQQAIKGKRVWVLDYNC